MRALETIGAALVVAAVGGCGQADIEIGIEDLDGTFRPLADGDLVPVLLGANALNMVVLSLRVPGAAGELPPSLEPEVLVSVDRVLVAANLGFPAEPEFDGVGWVYGKLNVAFQVDLCCFNCSEAVVKATVRGAEGERHRGKLTLVPARAGCPDTGVCCYDAGACVERLLGPLCED